MQHTKKLLPVLIAGALASGSAFATNGYAPHGIGMKSKGMGGVSIAHQGDAVAIGGNPAGSAWMDDRADLGVDIFRPQRKAEISNSNLIDPSTGNVVGTSDGTYHGNTLEWFLLPEFGYRRGINSDTSFAISMFGNGGMNTDYKEDDGIPAFGTRSGIDLAQLFLVPSLAWKANPNHSIGVGLNLVASRFKASGLQNFTGTNSFINPGTGFPYDPQVSTSPDSVTNNGSEWAYGAGVRVGWQGKVSPTVTLGATYQSKTWMQEFDDYEGLFAEQGDFDVPANFGAGIAWQATPQLLLAADVMQIQYSKVDSIANSGDNIFNCPGYGGSDPESCLGGDNGAGFGWDDQTVVKLGVEYMYSPTLTLRAGYNYGESPIDSDETTFNILAPGVVEHHMTLGGTYTLNNGMEITAAYMHAFENTVDGDPSNLTGGGSSDITMYQDSFGLAVAWKL